MKRQPDQNANQIDRFKNLARELGCDEDEEAFKEALAKVARHKPSNIEPVKPSGDKEGTE